MAQARQILEPATAATAGAEWARLPKVGESIEGLYRSQLFALIKSGEIRTAAIKQPGAARTGMRLIHVPSVRAWIATHVAEAQQEG